MPALPTWYELLDELCTTVFFLLIALRLLPQLRARWRRPGATPAFFVALGLMALFVIAEDVLEGNPRELVTMLDMTARDWMRGLAADRWVRNAAAMVSQGTGLGLALIITATTLWLAWLRRFGDAALFAGGTVSAWALGGLLKVAFAVPRPGSADRYGFPSGHTLVTLVAAGLIIYVLTRSARRGTRVTWYVCGAAIALMSGASRMLLGVHWLSDVFGGMAVGTAWLGVMTFADSRRTFEASPQVAVYPPSISRSLPVTKDDASLAR